MVTDMVNLTLSATQNIVNKRLQQSWKIIHRDTTRTTTKQQQGDNQNGFNAQNGIHYKSLYHNCYVYYVNNTKTISSRYTFALLCFGKIRERFTIKV